MLFFMVSCRVFNRKSQAQQLAVFDQICHRVNQRGELRLRLVAFLEKTLDEAAAEFRAAPVGRTENAMDTITGKANYNRR